MPSIWLYYDYLHSFVNCARCAEVDHDVKYPKISERCANCKDNHTSLSRFSPNWILEKKFLQLKLFKNFLILKLGNLFNPESHLSGFLALDYSSNNPNTLDT